MPSLDLIYGYISPSKSLVQYHGGISRDGGMGDCEVRTTLESNITRSWSIR